MLELHTADYLKKFSNGLSKEKIISYLIEKNFNCYLVSSFRNYDSKTQKYEFKEINKENFEYIFFDRDKSDQFVFCMKRDIDKKLLDLFN